MPRQPKPQVVKPPGRLEPEPPVLREPSLYRDLRQSLFVYRSADATAIQSDTTLTDDDVLTLSVDGNSAYTVEAFLKFTTADAADFKVAFTIPSGASGHVQYNGLQPAASDDTGDKVADTAWATSRNFGGHGGVGTPQVVLAKGILITDSPGAFTVRWAQVTSTASDTILKADSYLKALQEAKTA